MSGGSLGYLYNKEFPEVCNYIDEMETVEKELISQGYTDIAKDVRRLIEYCLTAKNRIGVLFENLSDVMLWSGVIHQIMVTRKCLKRLTSTEKARAFRKNPTAASLRK